MFQRYDVDGDGRTTRAVAYVRYFCVFYTLVAEAAGGRMISTRVSRKSMGTTPADEVTKDVDVATGRTISTRVSSRSMGGSPVDDVFRDMGLAKGAWISRKVSRKSIGTTAVGVVSGDVDVVEGVTISTKVSRKAISGATSIDGRGEYARVVEGGLISI